MTSLQRLDCHLFWNVARFLIWIWVLPAIPARYTELPLTMAIIQSSCLMVYKLQLMITPA